MENNTTKKLQKSDGESKKPEIKINNYYAICCSSPWCDDDCCRCAKWDDATEDERAGKN